MFDSPAPRKSSIHSTDYPLATGTTRTTSQSQAQLKVPSQTHKRQTSLTNSIGMTIPPTINGQKLSLPEFAAQITCFLWFESSYLLHRIEESPVLPAVQTPLATDAVPSMGFRKWLATILSTTQVSQNVVLLALLFVYRLKKLNPTVKGKTGSEFRLITVALMLGNKFLDDNTYTNKTWAEVSGITVQEIHIMEVEFLQNMKYNLFTSDAQWNEWHRKLCRFWHYWYAASQTSSKTSGTISPAPLPSPPNSQATSPAFAGTPTPQYQQQTSHSACEGSSPVGPLPPVDLSALGRKRSYDAIGSFVMEPPAKRVTRSMAPNISVSIPQFPVQLPPPITTQTRLMQRESPPLPSSVSTGPNLTIPSIPSMNFGLTLPEPGSRAMSMVFPNQAHVPHSSTSGLAQSVTHNISVPSIGQQSRTSSPYIQHASNTSSPSTAYPTQHLSPSYFLGNRSSPYRPVRGVSTLLIPQPQAPAPPPMSLDQIQYQPLAKVRNQYRNGVLPYLPNEIVWGSSNHR
ncbi:cyclin-domain-containing protein [Kalaharituber pfeilii]|nr:cyclin-domain-containing protein [Kalaharituber pfeilii]